MVTIGKNTQVKLYRMSMAEHECPWGLKAINLLKEAGVIFEDIKLTTQEEVNLFKAKYNVATTPQIFFDNERIGGYTDLAHYFRVTPQKADYSYTPVIALFSTAGLVSLATSLGMTGFMGVSLSMLSSLKLMDINAFAESFAKYDLICQRFKTYGKIYPFLESMIGLGLLSGILPLVTGISAFGLGISGAISVFKAVYIDKLELNCACVGGNSKAPLGVVSFAENAIMAIMGASLIFSNVSVTLNQQQSLSPFYSSIVQESSIKK
ncbi:glutaredoxin [Cyanobacterium sp. Dongsha4]|nr:glutaredoxin [Cyanobacterium sp. Dongsha4]